MSEPVERLRECFNQMGIKHLIDEDALTDMEQYLNEPTQGGVFLNTSIPPAGQPLVIDANAPTDNWEEIASGNAEY